MNNCCSFNFERNNSTKFSVWFKWSNTKKAQDSKEQTEIGEKMREKLEMAKVPVYADGNGDIIDNGDGNMK